MVWLWLCFLYPDRSGTADLLTDRPTARPSVPHLLSRHRSSFLNSPRVTARHRGRLLARTVEKEVSKQNKNRKTRDFKKVVLPLRDSDSGALWLPFDFLRGYLGNTVVYILCKRGLVNSLTLPPLEGGNPRRFSPSVCVSLEIRPVHKQCFHTEEKTEDEEEEEEEVAQLEVLLFISKCQYCYSIEKPLHFLHRIITRLYSKYSSLKDLTLLGYKAD